MPPPPGPPVYPLTIEQFRLAVRRGHGRAVIHLRSVGDTVPYRAIIREACMHDQRYEVTLEPHRIAFHADLVQACAAPAPLADELISLLGTLPEDSDEWVLAEMVYELVRRGDLNADRAWWAYAESLSGEDLVYYSEELTTGGERGLLLLAETVGGGLGEADRWQYTLAITHGDDAFGEGWTKGVLQREAANRPRVAAFLRAVEEWEQQCQRLEPSPPERPEDGWRPWSNAWPLLESWSHNRHGRRPFSRVLWARHAPDVELQAAARTLLEQREDNQIRVIASTLRERHWPLDISLFIDFLNRLPDALADIAMLAMRETEHPALRDECLRRCADARLTSNLFCLMSLNAQPGDAAWIEDALARNHLDEDTIHGIGLDLKHLPMVESEPEAAGIRLWLYEHDPCSFCREDIVKHIIACGDAAAAWVLEEAQFDSSHDTRRFVGKIMRGEPVE